MLPHVKLVFFNKIKWWCPSKLYKFIRILSKIEHTKSLRIILARNNWTGIIHSNAFQITLWLIWYSMYPYPRWVQYMPVWVQCWNSWPVVYLWQTLGTIHPDWQLWECIVWSYFLLPTYICPPWFFTCNAPPLCRKTQSWWLMFCYERVEGNSTEKAITKSGWSWSWSPDGVTVKRWFSFSLCAVPPRFFVHLNLWVKVRVRRNNGKECEITKYSRGLRLIELC